MVHLTYIDTFIHAIKIDFFFFVVKTNVKMWQIKRNFTKGMDMYKALSLSAYTILINKT